MINSELDAAGIRDPELRASYLLCRDLNARHGRTYFLAARLLAPGQRPAVHALYGFARWVDDLVDQPGPGVSTEQVERNLQRASDELFAGLRDGVSGNDLLAAVVDTANRFDLAAGLFGDFIDSMRMDLRVTDYPDRTALENYVRGSAEVVGLQMLPVLGTRPGTSGAAEYAAALGRAFQLTNFLRDIAEDLQRGRVYLPADELAAFGVDRELLQWCLRNQRTDRRVRQALQYQIAVTRAVYRRAQDGLELLDPASRPCVSTALRLYSGILERIEDSDFAVFAHRARVGTAHRIRVAGTGVARAWFERRRNG